MSDLKAYVERYVPLLPVGTSLSYSEYEKRAGEFLEALAGLTDIKHLLTADKIRLLSVQTATFHEQLIKQTGKTVTENKLSAEASAEYTKAREELEHIENDISYLKAYYDIFTNAHVFYRNLAKGINE